METGNPGSIVVRDFFLPDLANAHGKEVAHA
jgi:hypothetical protein